MYFEDEFLDDEYLDDDYEERDVSFLLNGIYTTAVEKDHMFDGVKLIMKRYPWVDSDWLADNFKKFAVSDTVSAVVKCHECDTYSEESGRNKALAKLNRQIVKNREWSVSQFEKYIRNQMEHPCAKKIIK